MLIMNYMLKTLLASDTHMPTIHLIVQKQGQEESSHIGIATGF